jgi:hypothetical protein
VNGDLFDIVAMLKAEREIQRAQACDRCLTGAVASDDGLRVLGWQVYDGTSFTGAELKVRICPACRTLAPTKKAPRQTGGEPLIPKPTVAAAPASARSAPPPAQHPC